MKHIIKKFESEADQKRFQSESAAANLHNGSIMVYVIIIFELIMLARILLFGPKPYSNRAIGYIICYSTLLFLSIANHVFAKHVKRSQKNYDVMSDIISTAYSVGIMLWAIAITTLDCLRSEQFVVYITVCVAIVSLLRLRPWLFITLQIGGLAVLAVSLLIFVPDFNSGQMINLAVFSIVFIVISITKYNASVSDFYNIKKIEHLNMLLAKEKQAIEKIAKTDQLTGLRNRVSLKESVSGQIENCYRENKAIGFVLFDIDDFKKINDSYGHAVGDECLRKIGECFLRYGALTVYRYGGEEFLAVCDTATEDEFAGIISELLQKIAGLELTAKEARITISAGFTYGVPVSECCDEWMIGVADGALYKAKRAGKNRAVRG